MYRAYFRHLKKVRSYINLCFVGNVKALSNRPDLRLSTMEEVEISPCIFSSFTMIRRSKTTVSHASDVEPPATRHFAVNMYRDEAQTSVVDVDIDDVK